jgi:hypothetical protein
MDDAEGCYICKSIPLGELKICNKCEEEKPYKAILVSSNTDPSLEFTVSFAYRLLVYKLLL